MMPDIDDIWDDEEDRQQITEAEKKERINALRQKIIDAEKALSGDTIQVPRAEYEALRNELELTKDNLRHMTESRDAVAKKLTDAINACVRAAEETGDDNIKANGVSDPYNDGYFAGAYDVQQKLTVIRDAAINMPANGEGGEG